MPYKKEKTNEEWSQIRKANAIGPAVGGIGHDVAVLVAAGIKPTKENITNVSKWYKELYNIAEGLKENLFTIDTDKAQKMGKEWREEIDKEEKGRNQGIVDTVNEEAQLEEEVYGERQLEEKQREKQDKLSFQP